MTTATVILVVATNWMGGGASAVSNRLSQAEWALSNRFHGIAIECVIEAVRSMNVRLDAVEARKEDEEDRQ